MRDFWRAIKLGSIEKKMTTAVVILSLFSTLIRLIQPQIYKRFFDMIDQSIRTGIKTVDTSFWYLLAAFIIVVFIQDFANQIQYYYIVKWWLKTRTRIGLMVFKHLQTLSLSYFEKNSTGKIKERVDRGIADLNNVIEAALLDIFPQFVFIVSAIFLLFRANATFAWILLLAVPLFIFVSSRYTNTLFKLQDRTRDSYESLSGAYTEAIINAKTIKSFASESKHEKKIHKLLNLTAIRDIAYHTKRIIMNILRFSVVNCAQIFVLGLGVYWTITGKITLGTFTLAWTYTNQSIEPLWWLTRAFDNITRDMRSVRRVFELLDTKQEITDKPDAKLLKVKKGLVQFKNVSFGYDHRKVLRNVTLEAEEGKILALVGQSGSGKSTLVKLLLRFYEIQKGSITIDGQNVNDVTQRTLRKNVGVVMQDSTLFNTTVLRNIAYGIHGATEKDIIRAAKIANAHEFIEKLPKGYNTVVGERGVKLSGGEQQRINIARAVLKNPPILVLDEATSSLDSESEKLIQEALWKLIEGRTTIIIAHRLSTIMKADVIAVMDKGKIVELDTHDKLVKRTDGIYQNLFKIQSGGYLNENL